MHKRAIFVALALMATTGCADLTGPPAEAPFCEVAVPVEVAADRDGLVDTRMLGRSPSVPLLETYQHSFWAVRGQASHVELRLAPNDRDGRPGDDAGMNPYGDTFLSLDIPPHALEYRPDGRRIDLGQRVLIGIAIDPRSLVVQFTPAGLEFNRLSPARLSLPYAGDEGGVAVVDDEATLLAEDTPGSWQWLWAFDAEVAGWEVARGTNLVSDRANDSFAQQASGSCTAQLSDVAVSW